MDNNEQKLIPKILLVDDEPDIVDLIKYNLEKEGYLVATAYNGVECLSISKSFHFKIISFHFNFIFGLR